MSRFRFLPSLDRCVARTRTNSSSRPGWTTPLWIASFSHHKVPDCLRRVSNSLPACYKDLCSCITIEIQDTIQHPPKSWSPGTIKLYALTIPHYDNISPVPLQTPTIFSTELLSLGVIFTSRPCWLSILSPIPTCHRSCDSSDDILPSHRQPPTLQTFSQSSIVYPTSAVKYLHILSPTVRCMHSMDPLNIMFPPSAASYPPF